MFISFLSTLAGLSIGYFAENSRRKKTKTQDHENRNSRIFLQNLQIPAIFYHVYARFLIKKAFLLKVTKKFPKTQEFSQNSREIS